MSNNAEVARPAPPGEAGEGFEWAAVPETSREWTAAQPGKTCRWRGSGAGHACGQAAIVAKVRGVHRRIWWNYCGDHSYGRWIEDGVVMCWQRRPVKG